MLEKIKANEEIGHGWAPLDSAATSRWSSEVETCRVRSGIETGPS
jgi:hypothetical protein